MDRGFMEFLLEGKIQEFKDSLKYFFINYFSSRELAEYKFIPTFFDALLGGLSSGCVCDVHKFYIPNALVYDSITYVLIPKSSTSIAYIITLNNYFQRDEEAKYEAIKERHEIAPDRKLKSTCTPEGFRKELLSQYNYNEYIRDPFIEILQEKFKGDPEDIVDLLAKEACYRSSSPIFNSRLANRLSSYGKIIYVGIANEGKKNIAVAVSRYPTEFIKKNIDQAFLHDPMGKQLMISNLISVRRIGIIGQFNSKVQFKIENKKINSLQTLFDQRLIDSLITEDDGVEVEVFRKRLENFLINYYESNSVIKIIDTEMVLRTALYAWSIIEGKKNNCSFIDLHSPFSNTNYYKIAILSEDEDKDTALILEIERFTNKNNNSEINIKDSFHQNSDLRYGLDIDIYSNIKKVKLIGIKFNEKKVVIRYSEPVVKLSQKISIRISALLVKGKIKSFIWNFNSYLNEINYSNTLGLNTDFLSIFVLGVLREWILQDNLDVFANHGQGKNFSFLINIGKTNKLIMLTSIPRGSFGLVKILSFYYEKIEEINRYEEKDEIIFIHISPNFSNQSAENNFITQGLSYPVEYLQKPNISSVVQIHQLFKNKNKLNSFEKFLDEIITGKFYEREMELNIKTKFISSFIDELAREVKIIFNKNNIKKNYLSCYAGILGSASNHRDKYRAKVDFNVNKNKYDLYFLPYTSYTRRKYDLSSPRSLILEFVPPEAFQNRYTGIESQKYFWKIGEYISLNFLINIFISNRVIENRENVFSDISKYSYAWYQPFERLEFPIDNFYPIFNKFYLFEKRLNHYFQVLKLSKEKQWGVFQEVFLRKDLIYSNFIQSVKVELNTYYEVMKNILKQNEELQAIVFYPHPFIRTKKIVRKIPDILNNVTFECGLLEEIDEYGVSEFPILIDEVMNSNLRDLNNSNVIKVKSHSNHSSHQIENIVCKIGYMCYKEKLDVSKQKNRESLGQLAVPNIVPTINTKDAKAGFVWNSNDMPIRNLTFRGSFCKELVSFLTKENRCNFNAVNEICQEAFYPAKPSEPLVLVNVNQLNKESKAILYTNAPYNSDKIFALQGSLNSPGIFIVQSNPLNNHGDRVDYRGSENYLNRFILGGRPYGILEGGNTNQDSIDAKYLHIDKNLIVNFISGELTYFYNETKFSLFFSKIEQYLGNPNFSDRIITDCNTQFIDGRGSFFSNSSDRIEIGSLAPCAPYQIEFRVINSGDIHLLSFSKKVIYHVNIDHITSPAYLINLAVKNFEYSQIVFINTYFQDISVKSVEDIEELEATHNKGYMLIINNKNIIISNGYENLIYKTRDDYQFSVMNTSSIMVDTNRTIYKSKNEIFSEAFKNQYLDLELENFQSKNSIELQLVLMKYIIPGKNKNIFLIVNDVYNNYVKKEDNLPICRFTIINEIESEIIVFSLTARDIFLADRKEMTYHFIGGRQNYYKIFPSDLLSNSTIIDKVIINCKVGMISSEQRIHLIDLSLFKDLDPRFKILETDVSEKRYSILEVQYANFLGNLSKKLLIHLLDFKTHCQDLKIKIDNTDNLYQFNFKLKSLNLIKSQDEKFNISKLTEMDFDIRNNRILNKILLSNLSVEIIDNYKIYNDNEFHSLIGNLFSHSLKEPLLKQVETTSRPENSLWNLFLDNLVSVISVTGIAWLGLVVNKLYKSSNTGEQRNSPLSSFFQGIGGFITGSIFRVIGKAEATSFPSLSQKMRKKELYNHIEILNKKERDASLKILKIDTINKNHYSNYLKYNYPLNLIEQLLFVQWTTRYFRFCENINQKIEVVDNQFTENESKALAAELVYLFKKLLVIKSLKREIDPLPLLKKLTKAINNNWYDKVPELLENEVEQFNIKVGNKMIHSDVFNQLKEKVNNLSNQFIKSRLIKKNISSDSYTSICAFS